LPYLFIALGIFLWADAPHWASYAILAVGMATATGAGGLAGPAWNAMLAKVIAPSRRGRLFGLSSALGGLLGVGGAAISRQVLVDNAYPISFGICFTLAFGSHVLSWICLTLNREPALAPTKAPISMSAYWRRLPGVLRENVNFARYLIGRSLLTLGYMGTTFYIVYARQRFQVDDAFAANLTMAALISQTLSTPLLGWLADHWGHKLLTEVTTVIGLLGVILIAVAPGPVWLYGVFMLVNAAVAGLSIATMSITMEFSSPEEVPTFAALANTILAVPVLVAPLLGGWLVEALGYPALFAGAIVFLAAGLAVMRFGVREPRLVRNEQLAAAAAAMPGTEDTAGE
jgi:MFS family permease